MELGANLGDLDGIDAPNKIKWGWGSCKLPKMSFFFFLGMMHWWGLGMCTM
jgi:hypothetical protein